MQKSRFSVVWATVVLMLAVTAPANANIGVPMIMLVWPQSWILLLLVIPVEALVARQIIRKEWKPCLKMSALANLFSSLVGIPVTWLVILLLEMLISDGGTAKGLDTIPQKIYAVTVQSAWLIPYEDSTWMVPAAMAFLCIPFFFMSVWAEGWIARKVVSKEDSAKVRRWAWFANVATYTPLFLLFVILTIVELAR